MSNNESLNVEGATGIAQVPSCQGCYTKAEIKKIRFSWTIDNFSHYRKNAHTEYLHSLRFPTGNRRTNGDDHENWSLQMYLKRKMVFGGKFIGIFFTRNLRMESGPVHAKCKFSVLNVNSEEVWSVTTREHALMPQKRSWGFPYFMSWDYLSANAHKYLPGDKLTVIAEISVRKRCETTAIVDSIPIKFSVPECNLSEHLGRLFETEEFSDVTLIAGEKGQHEFKAHKSVLAARSPVFYGMFRHKEMEEQKTGRVQIPDVRADVLRELLRFIYTGKVNCLNDGIKIVTELLSAADKYDLERLKATCGKSLYESLCVGNATEILILADLHSCKELKEQSIKFINSEGKKVMKTEGWKTMIQLHPHLFSDLYKKSLESQDTATTTGRRRKRYLFS